MKKTSLLLALIAPVSMDSIASSFIDNSQVKLTTRNYYLDRDFTDFKAIPGAKDWAQGFIFNIQSGYTAGPVGFGLDLQTLSSVKLYADEKYLASGLLPTSAPNRERSDTASEIGVTVKAKYKATEVKVGTLEPWTPVIFSSPSRLLPQTFLGGMLQSRDVENLELTAGYISKVNHRDSTNYQKLSNSSFNGRFQAAESDYFAFAGAQYQLAPQTQIGLYHGQAQDLYQQTALTFKHSAELQPELSFISDLRLWHSDEDGQARAGLVDNTLVTANFSLKQQQHKLTFSTMQNYGETAHPYLSGGEVLIFIDGWSTDFLNPKERVYGIRYDYDFKDYVPGLQFMTRYTKGTEIKLPHHSRNKFEEDSLDFDIKYTVQNGLFKGVGLRARYAMYDNNFDQTASFKPANETRFNMDYTWRFK